MFVLGETGGSRRSQLVGLAILALISIGAVAHWWTRPADDSVPFVCVASGPETGREEAQKLCVRQARDTAMHSPLSKQSTHDLTASRIHEAVDEAICLPNGKLVCRRGIDRAGPATDAELALVRRVLQAEGFPDAVVRLSRPQDPAPDDTVVYGVRLGDACAVGYAQVGKGAGARGVQGLLPTGECLA